MDRTWPYLLEITENSIAHRADQRKGPRPSRLRAHHGKQFPVPVEIAEPETTDLSCSESIDSQQHQDSAVADVNGPVAFVIASSRRTLSEDGPTGNDTWVKLGGLLIASASPFRHQPRSSAYRRKARIFARASLNR